MNNLQGLKEEGFTESLASFDESIFDNNENISVIRDVIKHYFHKIKTINTDNSSYGLKHIVEKHLDLDVTSGELIYAMHLEDYTIDRKNIHCHFNVGKDGIRLLKKANEIMDTLMVPLFYDHTKGRKTFLKYKYTFNSLIDCRFRRDAVSKKYAYTIIALELGQDIDTIYQWFNIFNSDSAVIPEDVLNHLCEIFDLEGDEMMNPVKEA